MQDVQKRAAELRKALDEALTRIGFEQLTGELVDLQAKATDPNLWQDQVKAQEVMKQQARVQQRLQPWQQLANSLKDIEEMAATNDASLEADLAKQLDELEQQFADLKKELQFSGPYDDYDAILSIYAGAGGTDAQDWADMLYNMYTRWANQSGYQVNGVAYTAGEEAGIKSAVLDIKGPFAYGKLKGEHGVHRLVRLSPYNADNLRQTSFAKVEVIPKIDQPGDLAIDDKDLKIDVYRSGGKGGQSVNTTDSAVRVTHIPTGITVSIQNERSQLQNKETAMTILRSRLAQMQLEQHKERVDELKGPNQSAEWGNQIRSYVLHPYKQVKDLRTNYETSDPEAVLNGKIDPFITAYLEHNFKGKGDILKDSFIGQQLKILEDHANFAA